MDDQSVITSGGIEKIGLPDSFITVKLNGEKHKMEHPIGEHTAGVQYIFEVLTTGEYAVLKSLDELDAVGHRMVHGGEKFNKSVRLTPEVMKAFAECNDLAPLHNPANIKGVNAVTALLPNIPQVGVFDTAFHQTMPDYAYMYALPYNLYKEYGVRRYGFHGTSHRYVSQRVCEFLGVKPEEKRIITCHIGNGASITAVKNSKCVDTSMGVTPLEGLIMGTRSGDLDPAIIDYLCSHENLTAAEMNTILNKKSGVMALSNNLSSDFRDLEDAMNDGNEAAGLAIEAFSYRVAKYIGSYAAAMNGVDAIAFTGGIGENAGIVRRKVLEYLGFLGITMDAEANKKRGETFVLSTPDSKVKVIVLPTNEELSICRETVRLVKG